MSFLDRIMNNKSVFITAVLVLSFASAVYAQSWDGNGVEGDPYQIWTAEDMQAIGADANYWDAHFLLMADINLSAYTGESFNIIGNDVNAFTGIFDGNGHVISNFTYNSNGINGIGLFGCIDDPEAAVTNLGLIDPNVSAGTGYGIGCLIGYLAEGSVNGCYVEGGSITGGGRVGGLAGSNGGSISGSFSSSSVAGNNIVGGLMGDNWSDSNISNCYSTGDVIGEYEVGGLVGRNYRGDIQSCYSTGNVTGEDEVGGLTGGFFGGNIQGCYSLSSVTGEYKVGGLVGYMKSRVSISSSYSTGTVSGGDYVGGLVGETGEGYVANCYSTGDVTGGTRVGGLLGVDFGQGTYYCYSAGRAIGEDEVGGLIGVGGYGDYTTCFWDSDVNPDVNGIGGTTDPNVIGLPTVLMQTESTFTDAGWDFVGETVNGPNDIWDICEGTNYPKLAWSIPVGDFICPDGVNMLDFAILGDAWFTDPNMANWDPACDISEPNDNFIDTLDLDVFSDNYLTGF